MKLNKEKHLDMYYQMVLIRLMEERSAELYQKGEIGGFLHLYIGQEAVSTGLIAARLPQDRVITAYRDHGVAVNCGLSVDAIIAELLGKATGVSKGKGGSMHMADTSLNFWGGHAIVGAHLPLAAGLALGDQYAKRDAVTICMFGDGATNIGYFHEALNLSKVWKLPVLWVCENNHYGMGTIVENASAVSEIRQKAEGYSIPNERVDGMDIMAVFNAASKAIKHVRSGEGPYLLEVMTYRFRGHSMGDPERYRQPEEIKKWQEQDPIGIYRSFLLNKKIANAEELDNMENRASEDVEAAVVFAHSSPEPSPEELYKDIYAD
jgi:pyruvate dehydrogenase E1 component alpha subunit